MTIKRGKFGKRRSNSLSMCHEMAKSGISLPLLFTPQFIACDDTFTRIINGQSDITPSLSDTRFKDLIWQQNPIYRASMQAYLSWCDTLKSDIENAPITTTEKALLFNAATHLTHALTPQINPGNSAVQHAYESRGASLVHDLHRMTHDLLTQTLPSHFTTKTELAAGKHIAASCGTVIHRTEMLEIIQYSTITSNVNAIPLLIIPSPVNRFYLCDLQDDNSLVNYLLKQGFQIYTLSWRNPASAHSHWNLESYVSETLDAIHQLSTECGHQKINLLGFAAGGMLAALAISLLSQRAKNTDSDLNNHNSNPINSATLAITSLQTHTSSQVGHQLNDQLIHAATALTQLHEVADAKQLARNFSWLSPNNLLWNPLVSNYFSGEASPDQDITHWNNDTLRTTAGLYCDFLSMTGGDPLLDNNALRLCGETINLANIQCDTYTLAGSCDHITPWESCYQTCLSMGGARDFVLVNRGHTRALVCPIDADDACYYTHNEIGNNPDDWLCDANQQSGSWWPHWASWLAQRSGGKHPAQQLSDETPPTLGPAPGLYVFE
ncbi:MAG: alpha/beta fold hydrolase [Pseudomonadales bacterium]